MGYPPLCFPSVSFLIGNFVTGEVAREIWSCGSRQASLRGGIVTGFGSPAPGARKFLVLSEKEFKDGHRGDLNRSRFLNAKQSESKAKVHFPQEGTLRWMSQGLKLLLGSADMGVVSPGKLDYVSLTSRDWAMHH
jgi:hypothetical protein